MAKLVNADTVSTVKNSLKDRVYRCYASSNLALVAVPDAAIRMTDVLR